MREGRDAGSEPGDKEVGTPAGVSARTGELVLRFRRHGDLSARDELVADLLPLASSIARRYRGGPEPLEDLLSVASVGVMKALHGFEPGRGATLHGYAAHVIEGEIRHHFRDCSELVHVPRGLRSRALRVARVRTELVERLGRAPRPDELAAAGRLSVDDVVEALEAGRARQVVSLDGRAPGERGSAGLEAIGGEDRRLGQVEDKAALRAALSKIPARDRRMLFHRVVHGRSYGELGRSAGLSATHVARVLRAAATRARRSLRADYSPE